MVANAVVPSLKITVPVGVPTPGETAATVAVNVTDWPETDGLAEEAKVVEGEEPTEQLEAQDRS